MNSLLKNIDWPRLTMVTLFEAIGIVTWLVFMIESQNVYATKAVVATLFLFAALSLEGVFGAQAYRGRSKPFTSLTFAAIEVVFWLNWFILLDYGLYSRHGIGPALFILGATLTALHILERLTLADGPFRSRFRTLGFGVLATALAESLGGTVLWVMLQQPVLFGDGAALDPIYYPLIGGASLFGFLFIEHAARAEQMVALDGDNIA